MGETFASRIEASRERVSPRVEIEQKEKRCAREIQFPIAFFVGAQHAAPSEARVDFGR
jgi:hypothetical protein